MDSKPDKRETKFDIKELIASAFKVLALEITEHILSFFGFLIAIAAIIYSVIHGFFKTQILIILIGVLVGISSRMFHNSRKAKKYLGFIAFTLIYLFFVVVAIIFIQSEDKSCNCDSTIQDYMPQYLIDFFTHKTPIINAENNSNESVQQINTPIILSQINISKYDVSFEDSSLVIQTILNSGEFKNSNYKYITSTKLFNDIDENHSLFSFVNDYLSNNKDSSQPYIFYRFISAKEKYLIGFTSSKVFPIDLDGKAKNRLELIPAPWKEYDDLVFIPEKNIINADYQDKVDPDFPGKTISILKLTVR